MINDVRRYWQAVNLFKQHGAVNPNGHGIRSLKYLAIRTECESLRDRICLFIYQETGEHFYPYVEAESILDVA